MPPALLVEADQRFRLLVVDRKASRDGFRLVVRALHKLRAAHRADQGIRQGSDVEDALAGRADAPPGQPLQDLLVPDLDLDRQVGRCEMVQRLGLRNRTGKTVQQKTVPAVVHLKPLLDHTNGDVVRHQLSGVDVGLGFAAGGRAIGDCGAEHVAGGDVG